ncbi:MAG: acylneuraminate cytidylyltransferase [Ilumatobacter sp.]|nr:acylneuraminate cytidylyltransferase [Ilumatobacter sp.]
MRNLVDRASVAIIPARGGSKGLPGKNLKAVGGVPLVVRAVEAAHAAGIERVVVTTDDPQIAASASGAGAEIVDRPADLASDTATSESAVLHALDAISTGESEPTVVAFLQCTSPFIDSLALRRAIDLVADGADSAFAARPSHGFLWRTSPDSQAYGVNHDSSVRLRRQDRPPEWLETGAFYVFRTAGFREANHRFFGRVELVEVGAEDSLEIDDHADLRLARSLAGGGEATMLPPIDVDVLVTDFDGVHTDDTAFVDETGRESVRVKRGDGLGVSRLRRAGVRILILSTEKNAVVARRAEKLGVECLHGIDDKRAALEAWLFQEGIEPQRVAYVGNDLNDLGCLELAGVAISVADGHPEVKSAADHTATRKGGDGVVREIADAVLEAVDRRST